MSNLTLFDPFREMVTLRSMLDQAFDRMLDTPGQGCGI